MTKIVHSYDPVTGVYVGPVAADPSPLEPDEYLIPAFATESEPPQAGAQQAAVFANGAWSLAADHRGETRWTGYETSYVVTALGVPEGSIERPTAPPPTEVDYAAAIQAHIDAQAATRGYADGVSCCSYHDSSNVAWAAEAQAFKAWRDVVWAYGFGELAKVQGGQRAQPSVAAMIAELPTITWPI